MLEVLDHDHTYSALPKSNMFSCSYSINNLYQFQNNATKQLNKLEDSESIDEAVCPLTLSYKDPEVLFSSLKFDTWASIHNFGTLILHMHKFIMLTIACTDQDFFVRGVQL